MIKSPNTILRLLRSKKVKVKVHEINSDLKGYVYYENGVIHIQNRQQIKWRVSTLIHECLHLLNPQYKREEHEHLILGVEKEVMDKLTKTEYNALSKYVV